MSELTTEEIEARLQALVPAAPTARLKDRIEKALLSDDPLPAALPEPEKGKVLRPSFLRWVPVAAAACLALFLSMQVIPQLQGTQETVLAGVHAEAPMESPSSTPAIAGVEAPISPVSLSEGDASAKLVRTVDEGVRQLANGQVVRVLRYEYLDSKEFVDPATGRNVRMTLPRTEWRQVPAKLD
ncbi:MAG: hypothetical protein AAF555_01560 [Verrucomicrobiota bacterium]